MGTGMVLDKNSDNHDSMSTIAFMHTIQFSLHSFTKISLKIYFKRRMVCFIIDNLHLQKMLPF